MVENVMESDITLDVDDDGIWLIQETEWGTKQLGHVSWRSITRGVEKALRKEKFLIALINMDEEDDLL
ncbi:hypothetical protein N9Z41_02670 [bacterium]|nr:hypothetical protein [bacterium]